MPEDQDQQGADDGSEDDTKPQEKSALDQAVTKLHDMTGCSPDDARAFMKLLIPALDELHQQSEDAHEGG